MASRATRNTVRSTKPAQQHLGRSFVPGGSVRPGNPPLVSYSQQAPPPRHPAPAQTYPVAQPPAPAPAPAPPKTEMRDLDGDVAMETAAANKTPLTQAQIEKLREEKRKFFQSLKGVPGVRKKPTKQMVQRRLKKHLTPKNATVALQEACPGAKYNFSLMPASSPPFYTAEVEIDGKKYHGVGSNKALARASAAERALQSLIKEPTVTKDADGNEVDEDNTPWSALAGFALHKLFCDWRQGRVGAPLSVESAVPQSGQDMGSAAAAAAGFMNDTPAPGAFQFFGGSAKMGVPAAKNGAAKEKEQKRKPAKELPKDAAARHPVMLLHEMRPQVTFDVAEVVEQKAGVDGPSITMTVTTDGQTFQGKARNKKLAKVLVAKAANTALFGVQYPAAME